MKKEAYYFPSVTYHFSWCILVNESIVEVICIFYVEAAINLDLEISTICIVQ